MENDGRQQDIEEDFRVESNLRGKTANEASVEEEQDILFGFGFLLWLRRHLAQHVVLLHIVNVAGVDLPFERVLEELAADVEQ